MTEKRFTLAYADYDWWAICDKENPTELGISGEEVVKLLNELYEENDELKEIFKTMVKQLEMEINSEETIYRGTFVFSGETFMLLKKICK